VSSPFGPSAVLVGVLVIVSVGVVLGALSERTRNLAVSIVTHAIDNVVLSFTADLSL
jgi:membrane protease YdiL (CAAX protease family)